MINWKKIAIAAMTCSLLVACSDEIVNPPTLLKDVDSSFEHKELWAESIGVGDGGKFNSMRPSVWEDKVLMADSAGLVTAFDRTTGDIIWEKELGVGLSGGVTAVAGIVAVGTKDAKVITLDVNDGSTLWTKSVTAEVLSKPAVSEGKLIVRTADGKIFALDANSGKQLWFYDRVIPSLTLRGTSAPLATNGLVFSGFANGKMAAFNSESGDLLWEQRISMPRGSSELSRIVDVDVTPVIYGSYLYAAGYNGFAIALDLNSGRFLWRKEASVTQELLVDAYNVYMVNTDGAVIALDRFTGDERWKSGDLLYRRPSGASDLDETIVLGDSEGYLHWLNKETGEIVARKHLDDNGIAHAPLVTDKEIIINSRYGYLYVLDKEAAKD